MNGAVQNVPLASCDLSEKGEKGEKGNVRKLGRLDILLQVFKGTWISPLTCREAEQIKLPSLAKHIQLRWCNIWIWADWIIPWKTMFCGQMVEWKWHESPAVWILRMAKFHVTLAKEKFCIMNLIAGGRSHMYNLFSDSTWTPSSRRCNSLLIPSALLLMHCSLRAVQLESKLFWWIQILFYISLPIVYRDVKGQRATDMYLTHVDIPHHLHKPMVLFWMLFLNNC